MALLLTMATMLVPSTEQNVVEARRLTVGPPIVRQCKRMGHSTRTCWRWWRVVRPYRAWLERTARCESGGRWYIATGNGFYGGLQFTLSSWRAVGGWGYPHNAGKLEQMYRGVRLLWLQGRGAWPVCG